MSLERKIEALLFAAAKPLSFKQLSGVLEVEKALIEQAVMALKARLNTDTSGIHLLQHEQKVQLVTHPEEAQTVEAFVKEDLGGELTKPSVETLTIIAYRGPLTKPELECIRGINCTLILRNLLMRGLIVESEDKERLQPVYHVSLDFLRHLGIASLEELPEYHALHTNEEITRLLAGQSDQV